MDEVLVEDGDVAEESNVLGKSKGERGLRQLDFPGARGSFKKSRLELGQTLEGTVVVKGRPPGVKDSLLELWQPQRNRRAIASFSGVVDEANSHGEVVREAPTRAILVRMVVGVVGFNRDRGRIDQ